MKNSIKKLNSLKKAYVRLLQALKSESNSEIVVDATIQRFEFTFELSWKTIKSLAMEIGAGDCNSARSCLKLAYRLGWISDEKTWLSLLEMRNLTSHTYNEATAKEVYEYIKENHEVFGNLIESLEAELRGSENGKV